MRLNIRNRIECIQKAIVEAKPQAELLGAQEIEIQMKKRIFVRGQDINGNRIGDYSTEPFYVNPEGEALRQLNKSRFRPKGKNSRFSKFKNGNPRKTRYLPRGYAEFRERALKNSASKEVNFNLSGTSMKTLKTGLKDGRFVFGFGNEERMKILLANEEKFGKDVFTASEEEREKAAEVALKEFRYKVEFECT